MADAVLDASALLAYLQGEPGGSIIEALMASSVICAVNAAEVVGKLIDGGLDPAAASDVVASLPLTIVALDATRGLRAGTLRQATRSRGMALGDRCCLSLAEAEGAPAVTADRLWAQLDIGVEIQLIR